MRQRLKEVAGREYVDPSRHTLDYALAFIPNEQVYGFIHEQDARILDEALQMRVVLCSPLTLFAVLAVIRQSTENFHLSEQTDRIPQCLGRLRAAVGTLPGVDGEGRGAAGVGAAGLRPPQDDADQPVAEARSTKSNCYAARPGVEAEATDPDAEQLEIPVHLLESDGR